VAETDEQAVNEAREAHRGAVQHLPAKHRADVLSPGYMAPESLKRGERNAGIAAG